MSAPANTADVVLAHLDALPTLPPVALQALQLTGSESAATSELVELLRSDQSLSARVLALANSAGSALRTRVRTLEQAVPLLGFSAVRIVALSAAVFDVFARTGTHRGAAFDRVAFWKHALAVGCAARRIAQNARQLGVDPETAFVAGLLHDLGKVALCAVFPKTYDRVAALADRGRGDIAEYERSSLGVDHTVVGRRLAERWRLPREYQEVIWLHHLATDSLPTSVAQPRLVLLVQLADTLAREQRIGYSGNHSFFEHSGALALRLGAGEEAVAIATQHLAGDVSQHAALLGLDEQAPETLYLQAISSANAELARVNQELIATNRRLAAGARYFRAMTEFDRHIQGGDDQSTLAAAMARAAALALQRPGVLAFALRDGRQLVDLAWRSADDCENHACEPAPEALQSWLAARETADAVVGRAPAAVRDLVRRMLDEGAGGETWLVPVWHDGDIVAGIVYRSQQDERARLADEAADLRAFLTSLGLALGRAAARSAAKRLAEDLAETNRHVQRMQAELLRSRTLAMVSEMAAGAGHELNSPLAVISGRAQMLAARSTDPDAIRQLNLIAAKAHECSGIVSELMDFARPRAPQRTAFNLGQLAAEVCDACRDRFHLSAEQLQVLVGAPRSAADSLLVHADREQVRQVLVELVSNAADAIAARPGAITLRLHRLLEGSVKLEVQDSGCGMSSHVLSRAFDPFYSHRHAGRGRGLGLPRAHRILEAHGGKIWIDSRPDEGTTVHVVLPDAPDGLHVPPSPAPAGEKIVL